MSTDSLVFVNQIQHTVGCHYLGKRGYLAHLSFAFTEENVALFAIYNGPIGGAHVWRWVF